MIASPMDGTLPEHLRFLRRQYVISRCYLPSLWWGGLAGSLISGAGWLAALALLVWAIAAGSWLIFPAVGVCLALYGVSVARASIRQDLARVYVPGYRDRLRRARHFDVWANPLASLVNTLMVMASCAGRRIRWRDVTYRLGQRGATQIVTRHRPVVWQPEPKLPEEFPWPGFSDAIRQKVA